MAVGASLLTAGNSIAGGTSFNTASIAPAANELILLWVESHPTATPTATGNSLTWVQVTQVALGNSRGTLLRAMGASPSSGVVTIDFGATSQDSVSWIVIDYSGTDTSGTNGSGAIVQSATNTDGVGGTSLTITLGAGIGSGNATAAAVAHATNEAETAGGSYSKLGETGTASEGDWAHEWNVNGTTTPSMSWATSNVSWGVAVEILAAGAAPVVDYDELWRYRLRPPGWLAPNYAPFPGPLGDATVPGPPAVWTPDQISQYGSFF